MKTVGRPLRRIPIGGRIEEGATPRRPGAATAAAVAALTAVLVAGAGCETVAPAAPHTTSAANQARAELRAGLGLYETAEYSLAARRFHSGAVEAHAARDRALEKKAVTSECTAWLRARQLTELADCTNRLELLQRRERRSQPGINTLIAFGSIAGQRPLPELRLPTEVQSLVRQAAVEPSR
jgi:hypothetical protein